MGWLDQTISTPCYYYMRMELIVHTSLITCE